MPDVAMKMDVTLDAGPLRDMYARMAAFGQGPLDAMDDAIGAAMVASTQLRFRAQVDPQGNPWKPSKRALKDHGKTLIEKGMLLASITHNVLPGKGVEWGSPLVYAGVHQTGADITMHPRSQRIYFRFVGKSGELKPQFAKKGKSNFSKWATIAHAYTIHLPARPYLGISSDDETEILDTAGRHLSAAIVGSSVQGLAK
jgi:phage gpG-like protein